MLQFALLRGLINYSAFFLVRIEEITIFVENILTMNAILQTPSKNVVTATRLKEEGYMTLEQSKAIIAKKIQDHFHK